MQLTMTGEYSIRAMLHLASKPPGTIVPIVEIARSWEIPESFLRKIIHLLSLSGLILSRRGTGGGIELAKRPELITLLEVVEAAEGRISFNKCVARPCACSRQQWCPVHQVWCEVQDKVKEILRSKSLAELACQAQSALVQRRLEPDSNGKQQPA